MKRLGKIIESFTIRDVTRVILLDQDCSSLIKVGDTIEVKLPSGSISTKVLSALLNKGSTFKVQTDMISSLEVENVNFSNESIVGGEVFLKE